MVLKRRQYKVQIKDIEEEEIQRQHEWMEQKWTGGVTVNHIKLETEDWRALREGLSAPSDYREGNLYFKNIHNCILTA